MTCPFRSVWHSVTRRSPGAESEVSSRLPTDCERDSLAPKDPGTSLRDRRRLLRNAA